MKRNDIYSMVAQLVFTYLSLLALCRAPPLKEHRQQSWRKNNMSHTQKWSCILVHRSQLLLWLTNSYFNWNIHKNTNKSPKSTSSPITISHRLNVWQKILNDTDGTLWTRPEHNCTFLMFIKWGGDYICGVGCTTVSMGITMVVHS